MKNLLAIIVVLSTSLTAFAQGVRTEQEISEILLKNVTNMRLVTAHHQVYPITADKIISVIEDVRLACMPVSQLGVESCVLTGKSKLSVPDGGPMQVLTKILLFNIVQGVAAGDIMVVQ